MSAATTLTYPKVASEPQPGGFDWRAILAWVAAIIGGGAGFWGFMGKAREIRSKEAQELWDRLEANAVTAQQALDKLHEKHEADMRELRVQLTDEREKRFTVERERDALRSDNVWLTGELGKQSEQITRLTALVEENRAELARRDETITDLRIRMERLQNRIGALDTRVGKGEAAQATERLGPGLD